MWFIKHDIENIHAEQLRHSEDNVDASCQVEDVDSVEVVAVVVMVPMAEEMGMQHLAMEVTTTTMRKVLENK